MRVPAFLQRCRLHFRINLFRFYKICFIFPKYTPTSVRKNMIAILHGRMYMIAITGCRCSHNVFINVFTNKFAMPLLFIITNALPIMRN